MPRITRPERYFLLVRTGDQVLDWREAIAFYAGAYQYVAGGGDHGWTNFDDEAESVLRFAGVATRDPIDYFSSTFTPGATSTSSM